MSFKTVDKKLLLWNISNPTQESWEMCRIVQDVRTCLIWHNKGRGKCVRLYRMSEYSGCILVNRNTLGPYTFVGCHRMSENSGVRFHCTQLIIHHKHHVIWFNSFVWGIYLTTVVYNRYYSLFNFNLKNDSREDLLYLYIEITVLEMKIWIYWSESNSWIYFLRSSK